jgi:hypothetical protein
MDVERSTWQFVRQLLLRESRGRGRVSFAKAVAPQREPTLNARKKLQDSKIGNMQIP